MRQRLPDLSEAALRKPIQTAFRDTRLGLYVVGAALLAVTVTTGGTSLRARLVRPCNLTTLYSNAGTALHGRCISKEAHQSGEGLASIQYTFEVFAAVKGCRDGDGKLLQRITFQHASHRPGRTLPDGTRVAPIHFGVPQYQEGQELVLFLTAESHVGLCAPVGLQQGVFHVLKNSPPRDASTEEPAAESVRRVVNGRGNLGLFDNLREEDFTAATAPVLKRLRQATARQVIAQPEVAPRPDARSSDGIDLRLFLELCGSISK